MWLEICIHSSGKSKRDFDRSRARSQGSGQCYRVEFADTSGDRVRETERGLQKVKPNPCNGVVEALPCSSVNCRVCLYPCKTAKKVNLYGLIVNKLWSCGYSAWDTGSLLYLNEINPDFKLSDWLIRAMTLASKH